MRDGLAFLRPMNMDLSGPSYRVRRASFLSSSITMKTFHQNAFFVDRLGLGALMILSRTSFRFSSLIKMAKKILIRTSLMVTPCEHGHN